MSNAPDKVAYEEHAKMGRFHLRKGFTFERVNDKGDVRIALYDATSHSHVVAEVVVPENEWASVIASVSAKGEDEEMWKHAREMHAGRKILTIRLGERDGS